MDKKELIKNIKDGVKGYAHGYNIVLDVALLAAGIKLCNRKLVVGAAIATIGTAACIYDSSVKPIIDEVKWKIEVKKATE